MKDSVIYKIVLVLAYVIIIILAVIFLDILMNYTIRNNRKEKMKSLAQEKCKKTNKPLIIFDKPNHGVVVDLNGKMEEFNGNITEIVDQLKNNSCVLLIIGVLEYIDTEKLGKTIRQFKKISGGDLYCCNLEKNAPRIFWDYKIKNVMDKSFYLPDEQIKWEKPNDLQLNVQRFYSYIFRIVPYHLF